MFKNQRSELPSSNLRRKYLHMQLERRKNKRSTRHISLDRPRTFSSRAIHSLWASRFKKIALIITGFGGFIGILYSVFFSTLFDISRVQVDKNGTSLTAARLQPFIDEIKGHNIIFMNSDAVVRDIESSFPNEVLSVKIKKSFPQKIILKIDEYPAVLNFHVKTPESEQKLLLNQIGFIIAQNNDLTNIPVLVLNNEKPLPIVQGSILTEEKLRPLATAFKKFEELFGMKVTTGEWKKVERELHLKTEKNFTVWIDLTQDIEKQLLKLKRALTKLDIYNQPLEYIDLRIPGDENEKIIFKRK